VFGRGSFGSKSDGRFGWKADIAIGGISLQPCLMRNAFWACLVIIVATGCSKTDAPKSCVPALPGWTTPQTGKPAFLLLANKVTLSGRDIRWNGVSIDEQTLTDYVRQSAAMSPVPFLIFDPTRTSDCAFASHVRDILDRGFPCREGACWQGTEAAFKRAPYKKYSGNAVP
jgi:hypothetical protein